jgi:7-cyano-7-deazaguanine synthase
MAERSGAMTAHMDAVVVFSGGQDSTTVLCKAIKELGVDRVCALTFDYGQRHATEIAAAREIAAALEVEHLVVPLDALRVLSPSAQTRPGIDVAASGGLGGLPSTFTPSRNLTFIALASAYAIGRGARKLYLGVCQTDYSGYPDCRREFIDLMEKTVASGNGIERFEIITPLMNLTKAETVQLAAELGCVDILEHTVTCYHGERPGCGKCPACLLRAKGFAEAGVIDPATRT